MLRVSSQTIHDIMFPDGRLRQTFFLFLFFTRHSSSKYGHFIFPGPYHSKDGFRYIYHLNNCKGADVPFVSKLKREKSLKKNWVQSFISSKLFSLVDEKSFYLLDVFSFGQIKAVKKRNFSIWHGNFSRSRNQPPCLIYSFTHCFNQEKALSSLA